MFGSTLALPVCEHRALHYHHGKVYINGSELDCHDYRKTMICTKHGEEEEFVTIKRGQ